MKQQFPKLVKKLNKKAIVPFAYATSWFHTLLTYNCPLAVAAKFWDLLWSVTVMHKSFNQYCLNVDNDNPNSKLLISILIEQFVVNYIETNKSKLLKSNVFDTVEKLQKINVDELQMSAIIHNIVDSLPLRQNHVTVECALNQVNVNSLFGASARASMQATGPIQSDSSTTKHLSDEHNNITAPKKKSTKIKNVAINNSTAIGVSDGLRKLEKDEMEMLTNHT